MSSRGLRIAVVGSRGVPSTGGAAETAVEEVGARLAAQGHDVTVYCPPESRERASGWTDDHRGMTRVVLRSGAVHRPGWHLLRAALRVATSRQHPDAVVLCGAGSAVVLPLLRLRGARTATQVDCLEWQRESWSPVHRRAHRLAESLAVRWSDRLVTSSLSTAAYYSHEFAVDTDHIAFGAPEPAPEGDGARAVRALGLAPRGYHLVVDTGDPDDDTDVAVRGYLASECERPLVVVAGSASAARLQHLVDDDPRVRFVDAARHPARVRQLQAHALTLVHPSALSSTSGALLPAMAGATPVLARDVVFHREVLGEAGRFFSSALGLSRQLDDAELDLEQHLWRGQQLGERARARYRWDDAARAYADLCEALASGDSQRGLASGRR